MWGIPSLLGVLLLVAACGASPVPTATARPTVEEETPLFVPVPLETPTPEPIRTFPPGLNVDGLATVLRDVAQVADPERPNRQKENRKFGTMEAGARVVLGDRVTRRKVDYWQVMTVLGGLREDGQVGWIPEMTRGKANLEPYRPDCPTEFPLTPESFRGIGPGEAMTCFGNTELTLSGEVTCNRMTLDLIVGGASFLDGQRDCHLGAGDLGLHGSEVLELLEAPPADTFTGRFLVRGHFDDPEAQGCHTIPLGAPVPITPTEAPDPGAVLSCRQMFVVSNVISQD
jgi:hypothetical protein